jgi:hypothetical protein
MCHQRQQQHRVGLQLVRDAGSPLVLVEMIGIHGMQVGGRGLQHCGHLRRVHHQTDQLLGVVAGRGHDLRVTVGQRSGDGHTYAGQPAQQLRRDLDRDPVGLGAIGRRLQPRAGLRECLLADQTLVVAPGRGSHPTRQPGPKSSSGGARAQRSRQTSIELLGVTDHPPNRQCRAVESPASGVRGSRPRWSGHHRGRAPARSGRAGRPAASGCLPPAGGPCPTVASAWLGSASSTTRLSRPHRCRRYSTCTTARLRRTPQRRVRIAAVDRPGRGVGLQVSSLHHGRGPDRGPPRS